MKKHILSPILIAFLIFSFISISSPSFNQAQEGAWKSAGTLPIPLSSFAIGVHEGRVYIIGGAGPSANVYYASILDDGNIGEWHSTTPLPEGRQWSSQQEAVVYNDRIYVIGGAGPRPPYRIERDTIWYANINPDGSLGSWVTTTSLPDCINSHITVLWNGRIYVMGGWTGYNWLSTVYYAEINADGSLSSWTSTASLPEPRGHDQAGTVHNGVIYQLGGQYYTASLELHDTVYFGEIDADGTIKGWSTTTSLPYAMGGATVSILGDKMYLIAGYYFGSAVYLNEVYSAQIQDDGSIGSWFEEPPLPGKRVLHSSIAYNGRIYVFGGRNENGEDVDTIYYLGLGMILPVPFDSQGDTEWCAPTSLSMVLRYYGKDMRPWDAKLPHNGGWWVTPWIDSLRGFLKKNYPDLWKQTKVYWFGKAESDQALEQVLSSLKEDKPVIMSLRIRSFWVLSRQHSVVAVGYSLQGEQVFLYLHDPDGVFGNTLTLIEIKWKDLAARLVDDPIFKKAIGLHIITGTPSPPAGAISVYCMCPKSLKTPPFGLIYAKHPGSDRHSYLYFDRGLRWIGYKHSPSFDSLDVLNVRFVVTNQWDSSRDYSYAMRIQDGKGNIVKDIARSLPNVDPNFPLTVSGSIALTDLVEGNYKLVIELYYQTNLCDSFSVDFEVA